MFPEFLRHAIEPQELARKYPCSALVAICERMISGYPEGIGGSERKPIIGSISPLVDRPPECRFKRAGIAYANRPAMFGKLPIVNCNDNVIANPARLDALRHLLGKCAEDIAILAHDLFGYGHLLGEVGIVYRQPHPIGRFADKQRIANPRPQAGEQLFGQDDTSGIADPGYLERFVHTCIITSNRQSGKPMAS